MSCNLNYALIALATVSNRKLKLQLKRLFKINVPLVLLIIICKTTNIFAYSFLAQLISHFCYRINLRCFSSFALCTSHCACQDGLREKELFSFCRNIDRRETFVEFSIAIFLAKIALKVLEMHISQAVHMLLTSMYLPYRGL